MAKNEGKPTLDYRIRRLNVTAPPPLAKAFIQRSIVDQGINLNSQCAEPGDGAFTWLIRIDKGASTLKTGGAPPSSDPFKVGYCFANLQSGPTHVQPVSGHISFKGETFDSDVVDKVYIPIFVHNQLDNLVILPISHAAFQNVTLSENDNCIGSYNHASVKANGNLCADDRASCERWHTAGSLAGFITLEDADTVPLVDLGGESLCALLTGATPDPNTKKCPRTGGKIVPQGDYCSTTLSAGGCADSFWLAATFAASAATINDGANVPQCQGASAGDGGTDSGSDALSE
jgi:hypothetical protein